MFSLRINHVLTFSDWFDEVFCLGVFVACFVGHDEDGQRGSQPPRTCLFDWFVLFLTSFPFPTLVNV